VKKLKEQHLQATPEQMKVSISEFKCKKTGAVPRYLSSSLKVTCPELFQNYYCINIHCKLVYFKQICNQDVQVQGIFCLKTVSDVFGQIW